MIYYALLAALGLQRLNEVKVGNGNLERLEGRLYAAPDAREKQQMVALHGAWFLSCAAEHAIHGGLVPIPWFLAGISLLTACQFVRHRSMAALGESWTHVPIAYRGQKIVTSGIYRYCRHPNYLAVVVEIALVPLLTKAYFTAAVFTALNGIFLYRRIRLEENQLRKVR